MIAFTKIWITLVLVVALVNTGEEKPKVLIIGDSISISYTPFVKERLSGMAIVSHNPGNAQHTGTGLKKLDEWLGDESWDLIQFNWGLWDLCYRHPDSPLYGNRDKVNGQQTFTVKAYAANLDELVVRLKETGTRLVFISTTYVPPDEGGRFEQDAVRFNDAALAVMARHGVAVNHVYEKSRTIHGDHGKGSDDVHYTEAGYDELGELIARFLRKQLDAG